MRGCLPKEQEAQHRKRLDSIEDAKEHLIEYQESRSLKDLIGLQIFDSWGSKLFPYFSQDGEGSGIDSFHSPFLSTGMERSAKAGVGFGGPPG